MASVTLKCRKCRFPLLNSSKTPLLSVHNEYVQSEVVLKPNIENDCTRIKDEFFFQENGLPQWVVQKLDEANWLRGKLNCPKCSARLGAFDFVTGQRCPCSKLVVPPIHIVKSKIDCCFESPALCGANSSHVIEKTPD
ncbi:hypothetical protein AAG570_003107 [Ranatra chinensis]|uniref:E3 ubiquitin-protein ligase n=1 Tax=Ranatra chinensis TaxID=642074 RepID=A0ABD0Y5U0_9HEMI